MNDPLENLQDAEDVREMPISMVIGGVPVTLSDGSRAPFSIYWAPKSSQWVRVRGMWVPFFEWALGVDAGNSGIVSFVSRVTSLWKDMEANLVQQVIDFQSETGKAQKEYQKQLAKANEQPPEKRAILLKYVESQKDKAVASAVCKFTSDMVRVQSDMLKKEIESKDRGLATKLLFWGKV